MQSFRSFIHEGKYPVWVKLSVGSLILKMKNLTAQIQSEPDPIKQNQLIVIDGTFRNVITITNTMCNCGKCVVILSFKVEHYKLTLLYAQRCRELIFFTRYFVKRTMCKLLIPEGSQH